MPTPPERGIVVAFRITITVVVVVIVIIRKNSN